MGTLRAPFDRDLMQHRYERQEPLQGRFHEPGPGLRDLCPQREPRWTCSASSRSSKLVFGERSTVVVDPSEEKIKSEFENVKRTYLPMHSIIRIDEVDKQGASKISKLEGNVTQFPMPIYTPGDPNRLRKSTPCLVAADRKVRRYADSTPSIIAESLILR